MSRTKKRPVGSVGKEKIVIPKVKREKSEIDSFKKVFEEISSFKSKRVIVPYIPNEFWQKAK